MAEDPAPQLVSITVTPNPVTGQLQTEVDNVPQLPFSHFHKSEGACALW